MQLSPARIASRHFQITSVNVCSASSNIREFQLILRRESLLLQINSNSNASAVSFLTVHSKKLSTLIDEIFLFRILFTNENEKSI